MSDGTEMIPKYRFDEINEKRRELEARLKELEGQLKGMVPADEIKALKAANAELEKKASIADKVAEQLEAKKEEVKALQSDFESKWTARDRHDSLRDLVGKVPALADAEVRELFLSKLPEDFQGTPAEFVQGLYADGAEKPMLLRAFLPEALGEGNQEGTKQTKQQGRKVGDTIGLSRQGRTAPPAFTPEQIESMSPAEYEANRAAILQSAGIGVVERPAGD